jgi:hypothetical protein
MALGIYLDRDLSFIPTIVNGGMKDSVIFKV